MNDFGDAKEDDNQESQDEKAQEDTDPSYQTLSRFKSLCALLKCSWIDMLICQVKLLILEIANIIIRPKNCTRSLGIKRGASRSNAACKGTRC